ncbi:MAG: hypothetical protein P1P64_03060 [Treponemataceae bacterium]
MLSTNTQVNTLSYVAAQQVSAGEHSHLPVSPNQFIYAHFEHVSGVPSNRGGVSISKLQILNSLIDNIIEQKSIAKTKNLNLEEISKEQFDELIKEAQEKMLKEDALVGEIPYLQKTLEVGTFLNVKA